MPLPTLVIAGAQKCGTSTLHGLLRDHPQVFMSRPKEVHFFDRHWTRGLDWYSSQFTPARAHVHAGESTPLYTYDAEARQRMVETLPRASIIVVLRDPPSARTPTTGTHDAWASRQLRRSRPLSTWRPTASRPANDRRDLGTPTSTAATTFPRWKTSSHSWAGTVSM